MSRLGKAASARALELPPLIAEERGRARTHEEKIGIAIGVEVTEGEAGSEAGQHALAQERKAVLRRRHRPGETSGGFERFKCESEGFGRLDEARGTLAGHLTRSGLQGFRGLLHRLGVPSELRVLEAGGGGFRWKALLELAEDEELLLAFLTLACRMRTFPRLKCADSLFGESAMVRRSVASASRSLPRFA